MAGGHVVSCSHLWNTAVLVTIIIFVTILVIVKVISCSSGAGGWRGRLRHSPRDRLLLLLLRLRQPPPRELELRTPCRRLLGDHGVEFVLEGGARAQLLPSKDKPSTRQSARQ